MRIRTVLSYIVLWIAPAALIYADSSQTKTQLNQLEARISAIKAQLLQDQTEKDKLYKQLKTTEKQIGDDLHELHRLKEEENKKQITIQKLTHHIESLNETLKKQQEALAKHLRARHQLGTILPWQYLFNQEKAQHLSKLFTLYGYLFQADEKLIQHIKDTMSKLEHEQNQHTKEKQSLLSLQKKRSSHRASLVEMKQKQELLINELEKQIKTRNDQLIAYRDDKSHLQQLLNKLSRRSKAISKPSTKHGQLKLGTQSLGYPLRSKLKKTKPLNQGLVFLAREGDAVYSVLPGKVIFSDWLKGYGLLLIIDHGDGLMSLYAHNASLFAQIGSSVKQGDQIATVGHTGGLRENGLYFEVRKRGKAIPPREWNA